MDITIWIIIIVLSILIIIFLIKNGRKKDFIKEHGFYYGKIKDLNNKYHFFNYRKKYRINHCTNSKRSLEKLDSDGIIFHYIENNIDNFKTILDSVLESKEKYAEYETEYDEILNIEHDYDAGNIVGKEFKSLEKFELFEKKMCKRIKIKDKCNITAYIHATYTSPKGRNNYYINYTYDYFRILLCYDKLVKHKEYQISAQYQRSIMTDSLRYDILKRDNFSCKICGATASEGAKLHVDHIIPISKGGKTEPNNLQTLCERCNLGKSNKL